MKIGLAGAVLVAMTVPGIAGAGAQTTGVSHPEQVPMTSAPEEVPLPAVYAAPAAAKPSAALKMRTTESVPVAESVHVDARPVARAGGVDGMIVGDDVSGLVPRETDEGVVTRVAGPPNQLPVGTVMKVRMAQALTTLGTPEGAEFTGELTEAVLRDGRVLLPVGSVLSGRVTDVHGGRRMTGSASIHLQPRAITLPDGTRYKMYGQVIDTSLSKRVKVDGEGTLLGRDRTSKAALGLSTGAGVATGAVLGGLPGAVIGGVVGAGVGTVVWLKQDRQEELPAGTKVVFSLTSPMVFGGERPFEN